MPARVAFFYEHATDDSQTTAVRAGQAYTLACKELAANWELAGRDSTLGVGHVWTMTRCPAYRSVAPSDCICQTLKDPRDWH